MAPMQGTSSDLNEVYEGEREGGGGKEDEKGKEEGGEKEGEEGKKVGRRKERRKNGN